MIAEQVDLGYGQLIATFWRRRLWFLAIFSVSLLVAINFALKKESIYESSMQLLVEPNYQSKETSAGGNDFTGNSIQVDYATQLKLMRSSGLLQKTVKELKKSYPDLTVEEIKNNLTVVKLLENETETKIVQVSFTSENPLKTQKVLRTLQKTYQQYNLQQQQQRLNDGLSFINKQLPLALQGLLNAEINLKNFRANNELILPETESSALVGQLRDIQKERQNLRTEYRETKARINLLEASLARTSHENLLDTSRLSQSSRYQNLLTSIQQVEIALTEKQTVYEKSYPVIQDLLEKKQRLEILLKQEQTKVLGKRLPLSSNGNLAGQLTPLDLDMVNALHTARLQIEALNAREQSLAQSAQILQTKFKIFPNLIAQYNRLSLEVDVKRATLQQLLQAQQNLGIELNRGGFNWQVVESPQLGVKISPNTQKDLMLGSVVALFLGGIAAFLREMADDTIHTSEQLARQGVLPLLGSTPKWHPFDVWKIRISLPWSSLLESHTSILSIVQWKAFQESIDLIYKTIQLLKPGSQLKTIVVTSSLAGEGKSTLVLGLALSAGRLHRRILVIDANLRNPTLHQLFELPNQVGLSSLLANEIENLIPYKLSLLGANIHLLPSGPKPKDPVKLLTSQRMTDLIKTLEQNYDLILIDTPPLLGIVDTIQISSQAKGVILVSRLDRVTQSQLAEASALLNHLSPIGIIANGAKETAAIYLPTESDINSTALNFADHSNFVSNNSVAKYVMKN